MSLTNLQTSILRLLASRRDSENLHRNPFSGDIDITPAAESRGSANYPASIRPK